MDFDQELLQTANRIAVKEKASHIGATTIWRAFLHMAYNGHDEAKSELTRHFGAKSWDTEIPALNDTAQPAETPLPLDANMKRLLSPPLGRLFKKYNGQLNPETLIALFNDGKIFQMLGLEQSGALLNASPASTPESLAPESPESKTNARASRLAKDTPDLSANPSAAPAGLAQALEVLQERMESRIFGQTSALRSFVGGLRTSLHRPIREGELGGSFLVFGPNGCGKGELIRILEAWVAEYKSVLPVKTLIHCEGFLPSILPSLRERIRSAEPSMIVLSEFEKYEPVVRDVLMDGLDRAVLQLPDRHVGGKIQPTDIRGAIVILLGNVGRPLWGRLPFKETEMLPDRERIKEVLEHEAVADPHHKNDLFSGRISGAFLDRIDHFIPMCQLRFADVARIVDREILCLTEELNASHVSLDVEPRVRDLVVLTSYYRRSWSGRQAQRGCRDFIEGPVRHILLRSRPNSIRLVSSDKVYNRVMIRSRPRLLLLDDQHAELTSGFEAALKDVADVIGCANVETAVQLASENPFDLVLLDLYFDKKPLWREYLGAWRSSFPEIPVVLLSGKVVPAADRLEIDRIGGVLGFVAKPLDPQDLLPALTPYLEHAAWQARIRAFEGEYGFGGDRIVFDVHSEADQKETCVFFSSVGVTVAEGVSRKTETPVLPKETHQEITEFLDLFLDPRRRAQLRVDQPRGLLLYGPPGNGKTMIARDLARRMRCNFLVMGSGDFTSRWAGVASERIKELFSQARMRQPCVIFIDEIDGVAPRRSTGSDSGLERDQASTVATLLTELDGFDGAGNVFLIGATNRKDALDEALLRPGRIDRMIAVPCPGIEERCALIKTAFARINADQMDSDWAAAETYGFSCAQIVGAVRDSVLVALRRTGGVSEGPPTAGVSVQREDFREAVDRIRYGAAIRSGSAEARLAESAREITAWHEAGHLILGLTLQGEVPDRVTIVPRGDFGGYVRRSEEDVMRRAYARRRSSCLAELAVMLGGGIAEAIKFGEHSSGVSADHRAAVQLAHDMVVHWGMGPIDAQVEGLLGGQTASRRESSSATSRSDRACGSVTAAVSAILSEAETMARDQLDKNRSALERTARLLLEKEELDRSELEREVGHLAMQRSRA
jgi:cell division protease FtsH